MKDKLEGKFKKKYGGKQVNEKEDLYSVRAAMLEKHLRTLDRAR